EATEHVLTEGKNGEWPSRNASCYGVRSTNRTAAIPGRTRPALHFGVGRDSHHKSISISLTRSS
ncbi:MAG: hypothetical protein KBD24_04365, partial [Candidatus Pacebacteria bacterium]|nr:hypothetical protein [Candidatus Paceibacterota bacterium]